MARESGKPKRCLTAYNIFFQQERQRLLQTLPARSGVKSKKAHGKIGFSELGKTISRNWKKITPEDKNYYLGLAKKDKKRYLREMEEWKALLAERDSPIQEACNEGIRTAGRSEVVKGAVLMDDSFVPVPEAVSATTVIASSNPVAEMDAMHTMSTEDLIDLAVSGVSSLLFDTTATPAPVDETSQSGAFNETSLSSEMFYHLEKDYSDFMTAAACV